MMNIDGSILEGGGQILRNSIAMSILFQKPIKIDKIRNGRSKPGLRPQHKAGIDMAAAMCDAIVSGCHITSRCILFKPKELKGGNFCIQIDTAGSISLMMQTAIPILCFSNRDSSVTSTGGTNVDFSPPIEHYTHVFNHVLLQCGININVVLTKRGFFPKGKGSATLHVTPVEAIKPITNLEQGTIIRITGIAFASGYYEKNQALIDNMKSAATIFLKEHLNHIDISIEEDCSKLPSCGCSYGITIVAHTDTGCILSASALSNRNTSANETGISAAKELIADLKSGACFDRHTQDQIIIFMALSSGKSSVRVGSLTLHTKTAIHFVEQMTGVSFQLDAIDSDCHIISCDGIGLKNHSFNHNH